MKTLTTLLFFLLYASSAIFAQATFSLSEAIKYAYDHNLNVKIAKENIADAEAQIIERRSVGIPTLNGRIDFDHYLKVPVSVLPSQFVDAARDMDGNLPEGFSNQAAFVLRNSFNAGLDLNALIFDGSYFTALKASKAFKEYVQDELVAKERSIRDQVVEAYLPPLIVDENLKILNKNITNLEGMLKETKATYEAGFVEQLDVDRLELSLANLRTEVDNLARQKELALNYLKFTMGYPINEPMSVSDNLDNLLDLATDEDLSAPVNYLNRPEYRVAQTGMKLHEYNIKVNKDGYFPSVAGFVSYQYGYQGNSLFGKDGFWVPTSVAGLRVNVPIFDGWNKKAKIQRARIAMEQDRKRISLLEQSIQLEVTNARTEYLTALERSQSQEKNAALAQKIYDTTQIKYRSGVGSSIEVTQAEQALYQTQQNFIQARYQLLVSKQKLDTVLGK